VQRLPLVFLLPLATACGGDAYQVYQIASTTADQSAGCYADDEVPVDIAEDTSTFRTGDTFVVFIAPDDALYLSLSSGQALEGSRDGDAYTFQGTSVDKEYAGNGQTGYGGYTGYYPPTGSRGGAPNNQVYTTTSDSTIHFTEGGGSISGNIDSTLDFECTGDNCPSPTSCDVSSKFVGVQIDAQIEYIAGGSVGT
jgi:hypothetical protein